MKYNIEDLLNSEPVFTEPESGDSGVLAKKSKKIGEISQTLSDFGLRQNDFNSDVIQAVSDLSAKCRKLEAELENEIDARRKTATILAAMKKELDAIRLRSTLNSNQIEKMDGGLCRFSEKLENYALTISPGARLADCPKGCKEADISSCIGYYDKIDAAKTAEDSSAAADFEKFCFNAISREFSTLSAFDKIIIDFYGDDRYAAVLYGNLSRNSIFKVNRMKNSDEPKGNFSVICTNSMNIPKNLILKSAVVIITGTAPLEGISEEEIENLRFLNDCGLHTYTALSESVYMELIKKGFRGVALASADTMMNGKIIKYIEKAMESAVPTGAITLHHLKHILETEGKKLILNPLEASEYIGNNKEYPYNCIDIMEKTALSAMENCHFPKGCISKCLISETSDGCFDLINGFNFVNHMDYINRRNIYAKVHSMLKSGGLFVMNGSDAVVGIKLRAIKGWENRNVYEALWTREQIISELEENGFKIKFLIPAGTGFMDILPAKYRKSPAEWIVGATI